MNEELQKKRVETVSGGRSDMWNLVNTREVDIAAMSNTKEGDGLC